LNAKGDGVRRVLVGRRGQVHCSGRCQGARRTHCHKKKVWGVGRVRANRALPAPTSAGSADGRTSRRLPRFPPSYSRASAHGACVGRGGGGGRGRRRRREGGQLEAADASPAAAACRPQVPGNTAAGSYSVAPSAARVGHLSRDRWCWRRGVPLLLRTRLPPGRSTGTCHSVEHQHACPSSARQKHRSHQNAKLPKPGHPLAIGHGGCGAPPSEQLGPAPSTGTG